MQLATATTSIEHFLFKFKKILTLPKMENYPTFKHDGLWFIILLLSFLFKWRYLMDDYSGRILMNELLQGTPCGDDLKGKFTEFVSIFFITEIV